jgi:hypothetical protein
MLTFTRWACFVLWFLVPLNYPLYAGVATQYNAGQARKSITVAPAATPNLAQVASAKAVSKQTKHGDRRTAPVERFKQVPNQQIAKPAQVSPTRSYHTQQARQQVLTKRFSIIGIVFSSIAIVLGIVFLVLGLTGGIAAVGLVGILAIMFIVLGCLILGGGIAGLVLSII